MEIVFAKNLGQKNIFGGVAAKIKISKLEKLLGQN
jgi:hypothetical protein